MGSLQLPFITTLIMKVGAALVFLYISQSLGGVLRPCSDLTTGQNPCLEKYYYSITGDVSKDGKFDVDVKKSGDPKTAQPTEPTQPTGPTEPTEPTQPTEPTKPTEPTQPTEPTKPTEPTQPTDPTKPTVPTTTISGSGKTYFIPSLLFVCALSVLVF